MPTPTPNPLATGALDRASTRRRAETWVDSALRDPASRVHVVWQGRIVLLGDRAGALHHGELADLVGEQPPVLLGLLHDVAHFAVDLSHVEKRDLERRLDADAMLTGLRDAAAVLHADDANLLAFASGITTWHAKHRFCGSCGEATVVKEAGHLRECPACNAQHFPRTDPAVIMLVTDGDRCVLGRQKVWPQGMYSVLAGFVEPGESLEDAVTREVLEEVGLAIDDVEYQSSQPWPFPSSLMLGFRAHALGSELRPCPDEIEDAQWFEAKELRDARRTGFPKVPPRGLSIAGRLLNDWLDEVAPL
jgi:NAD+ diphosphatase